MGVKKSLPLLGAFASLLVLSGCVAGDGGDAEASTIVTVAQGGEGATLDNALIAGGNEYSIVTSIYDLLMMVDRDGTLQLALATSAEQVSDTVWRLELREGVTFHDGDAFDAEDVKWTLDRAMDPESGSGQVTYITSIEEVTVVDPLVVEITTAYPDPTLMMSLQMLPIGSRDYFEEVGAEEYGSNPIGTGPFAFTSWTPGDRVELVAYDDHWRGRPEIDGVVFRTIPDAASITSALRAGEVDLITNVSPDLASTLESDAIKILTQDSNRSIMVTLETETAPFDDPRVRRALQLATDVESIVDNVLVGYAKLIPTLLAPIYLGYDDELEPYAYEPEEARELLAEAGYPEGVSFTMYAPSGRYLKDSDVAQALVAQWKEAGFTVDLQVMEWANFVPRYLENSLGTYLIGYGTPIFDSGRGLNAYLSCDSAGSSFCDPAFDEQLAEAMSIGDDDERAARYRELNKTIYDLSTHVFMYQQVDVYGASSRLDWSPRPDERVWLFDARVE